MQTHPENTAAPYPQYIDCHYCGTTGVSSAGGECGFCDHGVLKIDRPFVDLSIIGKIRNERNNYK